MPWPRGTALGRRAPGAFGSECQMEEGLTSGPKGLAEIETLLLKGAYKILYALDPEQKQQFDRSLGQTTCWRAP